MAVELEPNSTFASYRVEQPIGRGGMGAVYRARRSSDDAAIALKVVLDEHVRNARLLARFEREGRLAAQLAHPHLVPVEEAGTCDRVPFLAMAFIEGVDLTTAIGERGRLHPRTAAWIVAQIGSALDAVHAAGLVHRDVKPANVLLERRADGVHSYLTDFGLSKHVESTSGLTATGQWIGTVDYAAPEQIQAMRLTGATDVYALGCVLHHALTGRVPYPRERDVDKLSAHLTGPPPKPSDSNPEVPPQFDEVVATAMAMRAEDRYPTAGKLGDAALAAAREAGPEPLDPISFPARSPAAVDTDAPTAG
jgi:serine/threonine protein kinase